MTRKRGYRIMGSLGLPQDSVLGPLLWNIMYEGLLKLIMPDGVMLVAFADDDVAVVITAQYLEEISNIFEKTLVQIQRWMRFRLLGKHTYRVVLLSKDT